MILANYKDRSGEKIKIRTPKIGDAKEMAGSYYRKSLETHKQLLKSGEIYPIVDSDGVRRCCDCGFELDSLIED
ncbi:MAG: hypothetical protein HY051_00230 [Candidatus Aenigmarchaeota archaeon]|nr:hypothetical protein [Candidatus Aenigmarchaeota archaeon]